MKSTTEPPWHQDALEPIKVHKATDRGTRRGTCATMV